MIITRQSMSYRRLFGKVGMIVICGTGLAAVSSGCVPDRMAHNLSLQNWTPNYTPDTSLTPDYRQSANQAAAAAFRYGVIAGSKGANVRSGPGTRHAVITSLANGSDVRVISESGKWYRIEANANGVVRQGWVYAPLIHISGAAPADWNGDADSPGARSGSSNIVYMGYSRDFLPAKKLLASGQVENLSNRINAGGSAATSSFWKQDDEFLRAIEYGTITLDRRDTEAAIESFSAAERILEERESGSLMGEWLQSGGSWLGEVFGNGATAPYDGEGYEKVLMLNYLSIAYLLEGERKAYNVARRSIDIQNIEKSKFDARRQKAEEKLKEQESVSGSVNTGIGAVFDSFNSRAKNIPSAYVNPFGFYVTGMIQEYESYQDRSLRDNARISYEKALELNPDSTVIRQAAEEMKRPLPPDGKQLLHVVVADGFVPEKKVLLYEFRYNGINVPLKLPIYQPGNSRVGRIEVQTIGGRRLAELSPVADIEALCIRHQKDMEVFRNLRVALAFSSTAVEKGFLSQLGPLGNMLGDFHDNFKEPDTRSWMTLPASIQAARIQLSGHTGKVKLVTYAKSGKELAQQILNLERGKPNFIYARSIDNTLYAHTAKNLWLQTTL